MSNAVDIKINDLLDPASNVCLEEFRAFKLLQGRDISEAVYLQISDRWSVTNILVIYGHQLNYWDEGGVLYNRCSLVGFSSVNN